jgi:glyoxylase-like metal-dependent hydrolase (beta-lactamase superfamily II)
MRPGAAVLNVGAVMFQFPILKRASRVTTMKPNLRFDLEFDFEYGQASEIAPDLRRLVANNPGPMTFKGTNTYIVGRGEVAIVDPGPDDDAHRDALFAELARRNERVSHIFLTHGHIDHYAGVERLKALTGAVTCGFGPTGRRAGFESRVARDIPADLPLRSGGRVRGEGWEIEAVHTPGHAPDHLCFALPEHGILLSGDHVMAWNTSVIAPPEGRMADYLASLEALLDRDDAFYFPAHGGGIRFPQRLVRAFIVHRRMREAEIIACLKNGVDTIAAIVPTIYQETTASLYGAASLSVLGHLELLVETGRVRCSQPEPPRPPLEAQYCLCDPKP